MQTKSTYLLHTRHFVLKFCETIRIGIRSGIQIPEYYLGWQKKNTEYPILFGIEKIQIPNPTFLIVFEYQIIQTVGTYLIANPSLYIAVVSKTLD